MVNRKSASVLLVSALVSSVSAVAKPDKSGGKSPAWDPGSYSQTKANHSLMFAYGAYCDQSLLENWTCKWCEYVPGFTDINVTNQEKLQAFTGYDSEYDQMVISFRGTHVLPDWGYDIEAIPVAYPGINGGTVHKGFYDAWENLKPTVMGYFKSLMNSYPQSNILVTGHSLGAAMAQIAALDVFSYANQTGNTGTHAVYTYGSPRWGNEVMVDYFVASVDEHWRVVNVHDAVPLLPNKSPFYQHTPHEVWYTSDSPLKYTLCDGSGEDPNCHYLVPSSRDHTWYMDLKEECTT